jgi:hypothetical protein
MGTCKHFEQVLLIRVFGEGTKPSEAIEKLKANYTKTKAKNVNDLSADQLKAVRAGIAMRKKMHYARRAGESYGGSSDADGLSSRMETVNGLRPHY